MTPLEGDLAGLRAGWGLEFRRLLPVLSGLAAGPWTSLTALVEESGATRRAVESVLTALEPGLERDGDRLRLRAEARSDVAGFAGRVGPPAGGEDLAERLEPLAAGLPPSRWRLDHVPATPATMAARARFLAGEYDLAGASVVCLGDHDLTSLALTLLEPRLEAAVVDVDERVLDHVRRAAIVEQLPVATAFADLRLGLPPSLVRSADLVFTDPPYTPEGVRLFLLRALEALRRQGHPRVVFCYGYGERHLVRGVEVQGVLGDLRLAVEAVLPGFNRYRGAEAIGSRSSLWVCRPTTKTWNVRALSSDPRIYSRGKEATNSPLRIPALGVDEAGSVNLHPHFGAVWPRAVLQAAPERMAFIVPASSVRLPEAFGRLLDTVYDVEVAHPASGDEPAVLIVNRHGRPPADAASFVLAHLVLHPGAKVVSAWREGLIAAGRRAGVALNKNEARARIDAECLEPSLQRLRAWELPVSALGDLVVEVERSAALLEAQDG